MKLFLVMVLYHRHKKVTNTDNMNNGALTIPTDKAFYGNSMFPSKSISEGAATGADVRAVLPPPPSPYKEARGDLYSPYSGSHGTSLGGYG